MVRSLPVLPSRFRSEITYRGASDGTYSLLPFRFTELDDSRFVATNIVGEFIVLAKQVIRDLIGHRIQAHSRVYDDLKSRPFLIDDESTVAVDLLATKYRTKQSFLSKFTSLFMFVVTLRCDHSCPYCQVSRQSEDRAAYDMTEAAADRAVEFMFRTPSPTIKVEFQGGEPL